MPEHTFRRFDTDLSDLTGLITTMFKIVRKNTKQSLNALLDGDLELAQKVIEQDEIVNALEVQADEAARNLIIRHQPAASDLRFVFAATKIVTNLERMSDHAASMAKKVIQMKGELPLEKASIRIMRENILGQLKGVRQAFLNRNAHDAQLIIENDHLINDEYETIQRVLLTHMIENPASISQCLGLLKITRMIERIGDHAKNISEMLIYTVIGHEVRHINHDELMALLEGEEDD